MCGFAGVVAWDDRFRVTREQLGGMSARVAHRGPDGEGLFVSHGHEATALHPQAGLAHRRLAVLDLDARSNQPFVDEQRRVLVYNGEIYNFRELREELTALDAGYAWRTTGDTETLLRAYAVWGDRCVDHLNGMFAFAVWDEARATLFLARDRMGQKPLYVAFVEAGSGVSRGETVKAGQGTVAAVAFGSELSAVLALPWVDRDVTYDAVIEYLQWGYIPSPLTIFKGVWRLKAGQTMTVTRAGAVERAYFDPNEIGVEEAGADPVSRTRQLVTAAVGRQLVSDVPVGCFLSGGIDSSIVAAGMVAATKGEGWVHTFSIGFEDARYDETGFAADVARHLGTEHHAFTVRPDAAADLPRVAAAFGEPFGDSSALPTYYLARETRPHVKVALSGDGGDELFGGYDRYRAMAVARRLRRMFTPWPWRALAPVAAMLPGMHPKSKLARFKRLAAVLPLEAPARYSKIMRLFGNTLLRALLQPGVRDYFWLEWDRMATHLDSALAQRGEVEAALAVDRLYYLPDDLLAKVDRCSMQFALEVRSPFMDDELVRFAAGLRTPMLLQGGGKRLLREAFAKDLPAEVFRRAKMGFAVPIGEWFKGELRGMLRETLLAEESFAAGHFESAVIETMIEDHERGYADHGQRLYGLLMLELWWRGVKGAGAVAL